jgi:hypothetical protein
MTNAAGLFVVVLPSIEYIIIKLGSVAYAALLNVDVGRLKEVELSIKGSNLTSGMDKGVIISTCFTN